MDFYDRALASNSFPDDWVQDEEGIWQERAVTLPPDPGHSRTSRTTPSSYTSLSDLRAAFNRRGIYNVTDPTSVSSIVTQHDLDADRDADNPRTPESGDTDSGSGTPQQLPPSRTQTLAGIGDGVMNERVLRRRPTRLEETSDRYGRFFVEYKERSAAGRSSYPHCSLRKPMLNARPEKIEVANTGRVSDSASYQLAVHTHDDLSSSNGPERITEERGKIVKGLRWTSQCRRVPC